MVGVVVDFLHEGRGPETGSRQPRFTPERGVVDGMDLDDQAHRLVLVGDVLFTWQWRIIADTGIQVGWNRQDHLARPDADLPAVGHHALGGPFKTQHRVVQEQHLFTQSSRQGLGNPLHGAHNAAVQDEVLIDQVIERTRRSCHQQGLQGREGVGRFGQHPAGDEHPYILPGHFIGTVRGQELLEGDPVQLFGPGMRPWVIRVELAGQLVDQCRQPVHLRNSFSIHRKILPGVADHFPLFRAVDALALAVARECLEPQFPDQRVEGGLVGTDPLAADFNRRPVHGFTPGPSPNPVTGFENGHRFAGLP